MPKEDFKRDYSDLQDPRVIVAVGAVLILWVLGLLFKVVMKIIPKLSLGVSHARPC